MRTSCCCNHRAWEKGTWKFANDFSNVRTWGDLMGVLTSALSALCCYNWYAERGGHSWWRMTCRCSGTRLFCVYGRKCFVCMDCFACMNQQMSVAGQNHIYIYGLITQILAGKSPNIRWVFTVLANPTNEACKWEHLEKTANTLSSMLLQPMWSKA